MKLKRRYLFLDSKRYGQGRMFSVNPKGILVLLLFLGITSGIGLWALISGEFSFDSWKFRLANIGREQEKIAKELEVIISKNNRIRKDVAEVYSSLPIDAVQFRLQEVDSSVLDSLRSLSLEEMVERSRADVLILETILNGVRSDSSAWFSLPLSLPVPAGARWYFKNEYGMISDPLSGSRKMHEGIDISAERGVPVLATGSGRIKRVENHTFWGKRITLSHDHGFGTVYAHLGEVRVKRGDYVKRGDTLGVVGETGWTTSPLVHYEIQKDGESFDPTILLWYLTRS